MSFVNMSKMVRDGALALVVVMGAATTPAFAQAEDGGAVMMDSFVLDQLYSRIERLERDMQGLVRTGQVPSGGGNYAPPPDAAVADLSVKLTTLEEELAAVTGQLETIQYGLSRITDKLELMQKDVEYRLSAIEQGGGSRGANADSTQTAKPQPILDEPEDAPATPASTLGDGLGANLSVAGRDSGGEQDAAPAQQYTLPAGDPAEKYNYAVGLLRQGSYGEAQLAFQAFVKEHPDDSLASNAQYWLGEAYYVRNMYKEAASAFLGGLKSYPDGNKAPQSMLKLGMTLAQLGHGEQACVTLNELETRYPQAPAKVKARAERERGKAGCG